MALPKCSVCNKPDCKQCAVCKTSFYCSRRCQKKDWPFHKLLCRALVDFLANSPKPSDDAKLAILLPQDSTTPSWMWAVDGGAVEMGDTFNSPLMGSSAVDEDHGARFSRDHTLVINFNDNYNLDNSRKNQCVAAVTKGDPDYDFIWWGGPVAVFSTQDVDNDGFIYVDATAADLRIAAEALKIRGEKVNKKSAEPPLPKIMQALTLPFRLTKTFNGVIISCKGNQEILKEKKYINSKISKADPIYDNTKPIGISQYLGFPLLIRKMSLSPSWKDDPDFYDHATNVDAIYLNTIIDVNEVLWGGYDIQEWDLTPVGNIMVVREDMERLTAHQVEALVHFIQHKFYPALEEFSNEMEVALFENAKEVFVKLEAEGRAEFLKEFLTKEKFKAFFEEFKKGKIEGGDSSWANSVSPYETLPRWFDPHA